MNMYFAPVNLELEIRLTTVVIELHRSPRAYPHTSIVEATAVRKSRDGILQKHKPLVRSVICLKQSLCDLNTELYHSRWESLQRTEAGACRRHLRYDSRIASHPHVEFSKCD